MSILNLGNPAEPRAFELDVESARVMTGATGAGDVGLRLFGGVRLTGGKVDVWLREVGGNLGTGVGIAAKVTLR